MRRVLTLISVSLILFHLPVSSNENSPFLIFQKSVEEPSLEEFEAVHTEETSQASRNEEVAFSIRSQTETPPECEFCPWEFNPCNPKWCRNLDEKGGYTSLEFLFWRAENIGFSYGFQSQCSRNTESPIGSVLHITPAWNPGFRVGLGWNTGYDYWDVFLNYTWFRNNTRNTSTGDRGFMGIWPRTPGTSREYRNVTATARYLLNIGDLEIGRWTYLSKSIMFRPHFGVRGVSIHQHFETLFFNPFTGTPLHEVLLRGKDKFWGVGPRIGFNGELHLSYGFSIFGKLSGDLLYGKTAAYNLSRFLPAASPWFATYKNYRNIFFQLAPHAQIILGFQWQRCLDCERLLLKINVGWEANCWWSMFALPFAEYERYIPQPSPTYSLTTEGLTLNTEINF